MGIVVSPMEKKTKKMTLEKERSVAHTFHFLSCEIVSRLYGWPIIYLYTERGNPNRLSSSRLDPQQKTGVQ